MKIVFMGTPQAAVPSLERCLSDGHEVVAVYTQPDRPAGRGNKIRYSPVKEFALAHNLAVYQPLKIKTPESVELFTTHRADVAVVVAYGRILPESYLRAFPHGAVNVHFSLLPEYRGAAPVNWAIVNGEKETGVTTMRMDAGLDTGDILLQRSSPIGESETAPELMDRLAIVGAELLSETLAELSSITPKPQDHTAATLAPIMKREDGLIDWYLPADAIADRVRGFQPFPGSYSYHRGSKITFWRASAIQEPVLGGGLPGEILGADGDTLLISAGNGSVLKVDELQPEGKRRMTVRDFINGSKPLVGEIILSK